MQRLIEDVAAVVGAFIAVQLVRRLLLEREVRIGIRDLERL
jgi:hypothetical protein